MNHLALIVDLSDSMYPHLAALEEHVSRAQAAGRCTVIGFRQHARVLGGTGEFRAICDGMGTCSNRRSNDGNDLAAALRLASSHRPDAAVIITDAALEIYNIPWGPQQRELERLHAGGCHNISVVWLQQPDAVWAAEGGYKLTICGGKEWCPIEYLNRAGKFMQSLVRGSGQFIEGRPASNIYQQDTSEKAIGEAISMFKRRDYSGAAREPAIEGGKDLIAGRMAAERQYEDDARLIQEAIESSTVTAMDAFFHEARATDLEHQNIELRGGLHAAISALEGINKTRAKFRAQAEQSLELHRENWRENHREMKDMFETFERGSISFLGSRHGESEQISSSGKASSRLGRRSSAESLTDPRKKHLPPPGKRETGVPVPNVRLLTVFKRREI